MTPGPYPLALYRGDSYSWRFALWSDAAGTVPADLTTVVAKAEIRNRPGGVWITSLQCTVTLPNFIDVALPASISATLPLNGAWDLQLTYDSGDVATVLAGAVAVTPDVTGSQMCST